MGLLMCFRWDAPLTGIRTSNCRAQSCRNRTEYLHQWVIGIMASEATPVSALCAQTFCVLLTQFFMEVFNSTHLLHPGGWYPISTGYCLQLVELDMLKDLPNANNQNVGENNKGNTFKWHRWDGTKVRKSAKTKKQDKSSNFGRREPKPALS